MPNFVQHDRAPFRSWSQRSRSCLRQQLRDVKFAAFLDELPGFLLQADLECIVRNLQRAAAYGKATPKVFTSRRRAKEVRVVIFGIATSGMPVVHDLDHLFVSLDTIVDVVRFTQEPSNIRSLSVWRSNFWKIRQGLRTICQNSHRIESLPRDRLAR